MSHTYKFPTQIRDHGTLRLTIEALQKAGPYATGQKRAKVDATGKRIIDPATGQFVMEEVFDNYSDLRYDPNWQHPQDRNVKLNGYAVTPPGWMSQAVFSCNDSGAMYADNYSPYYDERQVDPVTGQRLDGTGRVHPDVLSGRKRAGDDGQWGDMKFIDMVSTEYVAQTVTREANQQGFSVTRQALAGVEGGLELTVMIPEGL